MERHYEGGVPPGACGVRLAEGPALTMVVASRRDARAVDALIRPLAIACDREAIELVVSISCGTTEREALAIAHPGVHIAASPSTGALAELRSAGMALATGDIVWIVEDDEQQNEDWIAQFMRTRRTRSGQSGRGGNGKHGTDASESGWASYFLRPASANGHPAAAQSARE